MTNYEWDRQHARQRMDALLRQAAAERHVGEAAGSVPVGQPSLWTLLTTRLFGRGRQGSPAESEAGSEKRSRARPA